MKPYSLLLIFFFGLSFAFAEKPEVIESKVIKRSFDVSSTADLKISNRYGNVNLTTWDQNKIDFHIEIQVDGRDAQKVKDRLNSISINFSSSANFVAAETMIESIKGFNNVNISIHYFVKLPKTNNINIQNQYGNIDIDNLRGTSNIELKYGNFSANQLNNSSNVLNFDYVTRASIDWVESASINLGYSKLSINKSDVLNLNSKYSDVSIGRVKDILNNAKYGNVQIETVNAFTNSATYSNIKVGELITSFVSTGSYGSISISDVKKGFNKVSIGANYLAVSIGISKDATYNLEGNFKYGDLNYPSNLNLSKEIKKSTSAYYEGKVGNGKGDILLNMTYGNAKIKLVN